MGVGVGVGVGITTTTTTTSEDVVETSILRVTRELFKRRSGRIASRGLLYGRHSHSAPATRGGATGDGVTDGGSDDDDDDERRP